jgi:hypothetical protein
MIALNRQPMATHFRAMTSIKRSEIIGSGDADYRNAQE